MALVTEPAGAQEFNPECAPLAEPFGAYFWKIFGVPRYFIGRRSRELRQRQYWENVWRTWGGDETIRVTYLSGLPELPGIDTADSRWVTIMKTRSGLRVFSLTHTVLLPWLSIRVAVGNREAESVYWDELSERSESYSSVKADDLQVHYSGADGERIVYFRTHDEQLAHKWRDLAIEAQHEAQHS